MKTQIKTLTSFLIGLSFLFLQSWATAQDSEILSIHKTGPVAAAPGEIITYIIEYSNVGTVEAGNVVIKDYLPAANMYTYVGSNPAGTLVGNVLTWDKTNIPELELLGTGIRQITVQIRAGVPGDGITGSTDGYYMPSASSIITNYTSIQSDVTNPPVYGDTTNTTVNQLCSVVINDASGVIKSATNTVLYYLMQVNNNGNIYDKFDLTVVNYACIGTDFDPLLSRLLDMGGNEITQTPWISPFSTYQFLIELTAPIGSNPFHFSCHDVTATSVYCPTTSDVGYLETAILGSPKYPLINISKVDSKDPVERGEEFTYTIFVFNSNDKYPAEDFKLYETYDPNIEFVSAVPAPDAGTNNVWSLGTLGYGLDSAETIQVTVRVVDSPICSGTITNMVECSYLNQSRYPTATAITNIFGHPDLAIEKTLVTVPTPAVIGGDVFYTLKYKNAGNCVADNVVLKDFYDNAHLNPVSLNGGIVSGGMIQWNLGTLNPGDSGQIVYSMMVDPTATYNPGVTLVRNYTSIITPVPENEYNNNNAMAVFSITLLPDLQVYKSEPDTLFTGVPYTYTITIRNNGDHTASDISLADVLPASLQFVSASDGGVFDAGKITWPLISSLAANTDVIRTVTVIPLCTAIPSVINEANVSCVTLELDYSNNYVAVQSVVVDSISPVITCIPPQEVTTNDACTFVVPNIDWDAIASDNCGIESLSYIISGATSGSGNSLLGVAFNTGVSTVTWTVTDKNGNISTCSFNVMVSDVEPPVFVNCPDGSEFVLNTDSAFNTYTHSGFAWDATASDNCGIDSFYFVMTGATIGSGSSLDGVVFNMGETTVLWTAADLSGNTIYCEFTVVVNDNQNPEYSFCLTGNNQSVSTDLGADTYTHPDASWDAIAGDNDGIAGLTYSLSGATTGSGTTLEGLVFHLGTTSVVWTATDNSGNITLCEYNVIVVDDEAPVITCPPSQFYCSVDAVDIGNATATDNVYVISLTNNAPSVFPVGTTVVVWTATDAYGNTSTCEQVIVVTQISSVFAGNDAEFCQGTTFYKIKDSWASDYSGLLWTVEQGDGYFDDPTLMNATYYPPSSENGTVVLKLTAFSHGTCPNTTDEMNLIIDVKPILTAEEPDAICSGDEIGLNVEGADSYVWNPGGMTGSNVMVSPNESISYTVIGMSKDGCLDTIEINLVVKPSPDVELVSSAYDVYIGDEVFLQASGADYYTWNLDNLFGDHGSIIVTENTIVEVTGEAGNGCHGIDTVEIRILGYHALKIPEGYSPNADGIHDKFDIIGIEAFPSNWLKVFNRWGNLVYESSGYHNEWDGFSNSNLLKGAVKLPEGTYYYILDLGDGSELLSGSVYISR